MLAYWCCGWYVSHCACAFIRLGGGSHVKHFLSLVKEGKKAVLNPSLIPCVITIGLMDCIVMQLLRFLLVFAILMGYH